jgi:hypothetical protein
MNRLFSGWKKVLLIACIHSVGLVGASIYLQKLPWTVRGEDLLIQWAIILKRVVLDHDRPEEKFVFINTSFSNQLIDKTDEYGFPIGNQVITDRAQLANILGVLNRTNVHKQLIVDVFFELESPDDSLLKEEIDGLQRVRFAAVLDDQNQYLAPIYGQPHGLVTVETLDDIFLKYRMIWNDTLKVLPLLLHETQLGERHRKVGSFLRSPSEWSLDVYIPDIRISQYDVTVDRLHPLVDLPDLLYLEESDIAEMVNGKVVVIGDFLGNDNFETLTGQIAGPLLLANIYLSLQEGDHRLTLGFFVFLYLSFVIISFVVFLPDRHLKVDTRWKKAIFGGSFVLYLSVLSIVSYMVFHKALNVFILSFYLYGLNWLVERRNMMYRVKLTEK